MSVIIQSDDGKIHGRVGGSMKTYKRSEKEEEQMGKETAARFSKGKIRHDLIPPWPLEELAKVYTYGSQKYDSDNWRKGLRWRKDVIGPLKRHLEKWICGEKLDDESNCFHLAMVLWNVCALMEYERCSIGIDDRNPYDLSLMSEEERSRRISKWKELASQGKTDEYNGLEVDIILKTCSGDCSICSKIEQVESKLDS